MQASSAHPPSTESAAAAAAADDDDCPLCGSTISLAALRRRGEAWKAVVQELTHQRRRASASASASPSPPHVPRPLVPPGFARPRGPPEHDRHDARLVHSACWNIAARIWGDRHAFTTAELDAFLDTAHSLAPFLPAIPFEEAPDQLDTTIDHRLDARDLDHRGGTPDDDELSRWEALQAGLTEEQLTAPSLLGIQTQDLPPHPERFVADMLRHGAHHLRTTTTTTTASTLHFWTQVLRMLANSPGPQLTTTTITTTTHHRDGDRPSRIAQAMRNLHLGGLAPFPHTTNFDVIRANALTILVALPPVPLADLDVTPTKDGTRPRLQRRRDIPLRDIPSSSSSSSTTVPFRLNFHTIRRRSVADAVRDRPLAVGMKYLQSIDLDDAPPAETDLLPFITRLSGIRLIRDHIGVMAVHARDGADWLRVWQQDAETPLTADMSLKTTSAEWDPGVDEGHLTVVADAAKDVAIKVQRRQPATIAET